MELKNMKNEIHKIDIDLYDIDIERLIKDRLPTTWQRRIDGKLFVIEATYKGTSGCECSILNVLRELWDNEEDEKWNGD